jgi:flagellin
MIINHNMSAVYANRQVKKTVLEMNHTMEKLSSGEQINRAADNASGLAVSEKLRSYIRGLKQAGINAQDGISFIQTTEGALGEVHDILHRIRELSIQASNGLYNDSDRRTIQVEVSQLLNEVDRIAQTTSYNGIQMLTGRFETGIGKESLIIHIGADSGLPQEPSGTAPEGGLPAPAAGGDGALPMPTPGDIKSGVENTQQMKINIANASVEGLQLKNVSVKKVEDSQKTLMSVDAAVNKVSEMRANLGAYQNRLEHTINYLDVAGENLQAAESRIRDTDMAEEMVKFTRQQILIQSGIAMLVQANIKPQAVLQLLG